jgi:hypothetical protein
MLKSLTTAVFLLVTINAVFAQKHRISLTKGREAVGSFTQLDNYFGSWCGSEEQPIVMELKQRISRFNRVSASIIYSYGINNKWRISAGYRYSEKGMGYKYTEFYSSTNQTFSSIKEAWYVHQGFLLGAEYQFFDKKRVKMGVSAQLNPEKHKTEVIRNGQNVPTTYKNLGGIVGVNIDVKIWRFLSLQINPFAEMGLTEYKRSTFIPTQNMTYRPYGFGYQVGLGFGF